MVNITVEGVKYKVTEHMGYNHDAGGNAAYVETPEGEKVAVKSGREWRW